MTEHEEYSTVEWGPFKANAFFFLEGYRTLTRPTVTTPKSLGT